MAICAGDWPMRRRPHPRQRITKGARCPWQAKLGLPEAFRRFLRTLRWTSYCRRTARRTSVPTPPPSLESGNVRNGTRPKTVLTGADEIVLSLYAKGLAEPDR
jgi:hypothetical protein